jgi:hypothetical protein
MNQVFVNQSNLKLVMDTGLTNLNEATERKILAQAPNGKKKEFPANPVGTTLEYQLVNADIDRAGKWTFQAFVVIGGKQYFGKKSERVFLRNLKSN